MAAATAPAPAAATPAPAKKKGKLVLIVACLASVAAGAVVPMVIDVSALTGAKAAEGGKKPKPKAGHEHEKLATVPVGDVVVNLAEERMTRYLRIKVAVQVEAAEEKKLAEHVEKHKTALKSWMISHIAGKTLKDVSGTVGVNRLQREILERFDDILYPAGDSPMRAVLFEEYVVQ